MAVLTDPSGFTALIPSPKAVEEDTQNRAPVGTGPFMIKEWKRGDRITVTKNPNYWKKDRPYLDAVVYRAKFVPTVFAARQFVNHGHVTVNGKRVNIPSYLIKVGDEVMVHEKSKEVKCITESLEAVVRRGVPQWLELEKDQLKGIVKNLPTREELTTPMQEQLIVELYSK